MYGPNIHLENYNGAAPANLRRFVHVCIILPDIRKANLFSILDKLGIKSSKIIKQIEESEESEEMTKEVFRFNYQYQTGEIKAEKNAGGLLLTKLGIVKHKTV